MGGIMMDKEFFVKCLTEGVPVYGASRGEEERFVEMLDGFLRDNNFDNDVIHYIDQPNIMLFEIDFDSPLLGLSVENEYLMFFQTQKEEGLGLSNLSAEDMKTVGELTLKVVSFVSAWNKKVLGILDEVSKDEYNKISKVNRKYNPESLYAKYKGKINSYK